jgi:molybdate transport system substrate-binding protein
VVALASTGLEGLLQSAELTQARVSAGVRMDVSFGGTHQLVNEINARAPIDLLIAADPGAVAELKTAPLSTREWLRDGLVVIAKRDGGAGAGSLLRGTGVVGVAGDGTPLGEYTRLALRLAGVWEVTADRTRQFVDVQGVVAAVAEGVCEVGVVYATDAARERERVRIVDELALPEGVDVVYTLAPLNEDGRRVAAWLESEGVLAIARAQGLLPPDAGDAASGSEEPVSEAGVGAGAAESGGGAKDGPG